jgi:hypothetical protein
MPAIEERNSTDGTATPRSKLFWLGRMALGVVLALGANVVVLAVAIPLGAYLNRPFETVGLAEAALLVACVVAAITVAVRKRRGLGLGLVVGCATGYVGLVVAVAALIALVVAVVVVGFVLYMLGWLFGIVGGLASVMG